MIKSSSSQPLRYSFTQNEGDCRRECGTEAHKSATTYGPSVRGKATLRSSKSFSCVQRPNVTLIRRKSAVERLQETKGNYVKSESVRDRTQHLFTNGDSCPANDGKSRLLSSSSVSPLSCDSSTLSFGRRRATSSSRSAEEKSKQNLEIQLRQLITNSDSTDDGYSSKPTTSIAHEPNTLGIRSLEKLAADHTKTRHPDVVCKPHTPVMARKSMSFTSKYDTSQICLRKVYQDRESTEKCNSQTTISRSKSDIGHRLTKGYRPKNKDEIERFFDTIGLDSTTWAAIASSSHEQSNPSTPPHFFESSESLDSFSRRISLSSSSGDSDPKETHLHSTSHHFLLTSSMSRETSIVEKNARVIKWLCNCRKAMMERI